MKLKEARQTKFRIGGIVVLATLVAATTAALPARAQDDLSPASRTVSGYVEDAASGERLVGATLRHANRGIGTTTNAYGFFSIALSRDSAQVRISYVGYRDTTITVSSSEGVLIVPLRAITIGLEEVEVVAEYAPPAGTGQVELSPQQIRDIPAHLGEADVLKALQLLPGVQGGADGTAGLYVRGGGPDQNLVTPRCVRTIRRVTPSSLFFVV